MDGTNGSGTAALDGVRWQPNPRRRGGHFESVARSIRRGAYLWLGIWTIVSAVILACVLTFDHPTALLIREQVGPSRILSLLVHVPEFMAGIAIGATAPLGLWHAVAGRLQGRWRTALLIGLAVCVALALKTELKLLFGRVPPHAWFWHQSAPLRNFHLMYSGSFPSGHMVIMGVLTPFVWAYAPPTLKLSWCVACTAVGAALMALNAHFFSDLVAGILLGITVGAASRSIDKKGGRMVPKQS